MDLWTSPTDRREPCGPCGQPVDNADALPTACPHSRASRPQAPQDQPPVILTRQHRTTLRRGCLHRPFRTTSASHSNPSQHRPRPGSPPNPSGSFPYGIRLYRSCNRPWPGGVASPRGPTPFPPKGCRDYGTARVTPSGDDVDASPSQAEGRLYGPCGQGVDKCAALDHPFPTLGALASTSSPPRQQSFMRKATSPPASASRTVPSSQEIRLRNIPVKSRGDPTS